MWYYIFFLIYVIYFDWQMVSVDITTYSCWKAVSVFMKRKNSGWYGYHD